MKNIANYYDIVEIGSHPTHENPGKGLGIRAIASRKKFSTLFIAFGKRNEKIDYLKNSNYGILEIPFNHLPLRTKLSAAEKFLRIIHKIFIIFIFIIKTIIFLRKTNYKIINIHSVMILPLFLFLKRDKKKIITFRGSDFDFFKRSFILRFIAKRCNEFHCVSTNQKEFLNKNFKKNVLIINNMVDVNFFKKKMTASRLENKNLLVIAGLRKVKGVDRSLEIYKELVSINSKWKLSICGDGPEMIFLKEWVRTNNLGNGVTFHGSLDRNSLKEIIHKSCICLIDSRDEGFPKSMLEALAGGCYISHSGKGECSEILKNYGYEYSEFNAIEIAEHINKISIKKGDFLKETDDAIKIANLYSQDSYCSRIERAYSKL